MNLNLRDDPHIVMAKQLVAVAGGGQHHQAVPQVADGAGVAVVKTLVNEVARPPHLAPAHRAVVEEGKGGRKRVHPRTVSLLVLLGSPSTLS